MKKFIFEKDIRVGYITANAFPEGVPEAHQKLHKLIPFAKKRQYFGISYSNTEGGIVYKAAAEELIEEEFSRYDLPIFTIRKGTYIGETLKDYQKNLPLVSKTFEKLLADPRLDKNGYCLEVYLNEKDMRCLVPIN